MNYKAFYRTYRPSNFDEVVGQDHIVKTLVNLIKMNKISHGYLFSGPRGTGKTSIAKIFANAINCVHSETPEGICKRCLENSNNTLDIIEIDAASNNSVNDIRTIREQVEFAPTNSPYKIYIIDEVHMLSKGAFNALLMTLEEPPKHAIFILATTNPDKIPDTILSRVQRYNFKRISKQLLISQLNFIFQKENIKCDNESIEMIASLANGSLRDALSIADQINAYSNSNISIEKLIDIFGLSTIENQIIFVNLLAKRAVSDSLQYFDQLVDNGVDISKFINSIIELLKDFLIYSKTKNVNLINTTSVEMLEKIIIKDEVVYKILDIFIPLLNEIKYTDIPQQLMQLSIIKICSLEESLIDIQKKDTTIEMLRTQTINNKNIKYETTTSTRMKTREVETQPEIENEFFNDKHDYKDITDEYFARNNDKTDETDVYVKDEINQVKTQEQEIQESGVTKIINNPISKQQNKTTTKTILDDFSNEKIEENFEDLIGDFSLSAELNKMQEQKQVEVQEKINKTIEEKLESINQTQTTPLDFSNQYTETQNVADTKSLMFKNNVTRTISDDIIDSTTELLNLSHEADGNDQEVGESLLRDHDTSKQIFDTNEINVSNETPKANSNKSLFNTLRGESLSNEVTKEEVIKETKEFSVENEKINSSTSPLSINKLSQPNIVNLFLLSKKNTFEIFKQKLENASCTDKDEFDSYSVLLKEVKFICSSNDFILVSSEEDWVIDDVNQKSGDKKFKSYIGEYFGNNVHFFAITKKEYIVSKELFGELKKSGRIPEAKPLKQIYNIVDDEFNKKQEELKDIENKSKNIFGNIFSRKKEG